MLLTIRKTKDFFPPAVILAVLWVYPLFSAASTAVAQERRQSIEAAYIPLADHYAAIVAYELYRDQMAFADFTITQMKNWDLLKAYFLGGRSDMAFVMSPLAMDMFRQKPIFKWVGLMHRDGNALAVNDVFAESLELDELRSNRLPTESVANAFKSLRQTRDKATYVAVPHLLSTHTVVLYSFLKQYQATLALRPNAPGDVLALPIAPPKAPAYIKSQGVRGFPAAFEQSLPWADVVETSGYGKVAWYSKDVIKWPKGHVECISLASNHALDTKFKAVMEVVEAIKKAGEEIERARTQGGEDLEKLIVLIRKHIPLHTPEAIRASLNPNLRVINYQELDIDKEGLKAIMDIAVEGKILKDEIDIEEFADERFPAIEN